MHVYPQRVRLAAIAYYIKNGSLRKTAKEFGISVVTLRTWLKRSGIARTPVGGPWRSPHAILAAIKTAKGGDLDAAAKQLVNYNRKGRRIKSLKRVIEWFRDRVASRPNSPAGWT